MPVTKESLLRQAVECRRRVDLLVDLKRDVINSLDNVTRRVSNQLSDIELLAPTADSARIALMEEKVEKAINALLSFESKIARSVHDQNNPELSSLFPRLRNFVPVNASDQVSSQSGQGNMTARWAEETVRLTEMGASMGALSISNNHQASTNRENQGSSIIGGNNRIEDEFTESSTVEIQVIEPADSFGSVNVEIGSVFSAQSSTAATATKTTTALTSSMAGEVSNAVDYRKYIVSKGKGKPEDFCQSSVELTACRKSPFECSVSHAEHPSFFFLHLCTSNVNNIEDNLNEALESDMKVLSKVEVGEYCVAPMAKDEDLRRAKILEIKNNNLGVSFSKLFYIDWGVVDWVATKALLELPQRFRQFHRQACPCMLAEVEPISGYWDDGTIALFNQQTDRHSEDNVELAITSLDQGEPPEINTVSLSRLNKPAAGATMLIALIRNGNGKVKRAEPMVPMKAFEKQNGEPIGGRNPPDVVNDCRCTDQAAEKDHCPAAQAIAAAPAVVAPAPAPVKHRAAGRSSATSADSGPAPNPSRFVQGSVPDMTLKDLAALGESYFYFRARKWKDKGQLVFYAQVLDQNGQNDQLDTLTEALDDFYSKPQNQRLFEKMGSQFAVHRQLIDGQMAYRRVFISNWRPSEDSNDARDVRLYSNVDAFYVDYGYSNVLHTKSVYPLERRFCGLSAQAILCKLFDIQPPSPSGFTESAADIFEQLCKDGHGRVPLLKGAVLNMSSPYDIVAYRIDGPGNEVCINELMVRSGHAVSSTDWK